MLPMDISLTIPDHWIEQGAWFFGFAVGGSIIGGLLLGIATRSRLLRALGSKAGMLAGIGYWLVYHTGYVSEREALYFWDRYGAKALEALLAALGGALG